MLFEGPLDELMARQKQASFLSFETNRNAEALQLMLNQQVAARIEAEKIILPQLPKSIIAQLNQTLVQQGIEVYEITTLENDLESIFMNLTNN